MVKILEIITPFRFLFGFFLILGIMLTSFYIYNLNQELEYTIRTRAEYKDKFINLQDAYNSLKVDYDKVYVDKNTYQKLYSKTVEKLNGCEDKLSRTVYVSSDCDYSDYVSKEDYLNLLNAYKTLSIKENVEEGINLFQEGAECASILEGNIFGISSCLSFFERFS